MTLRRSFQQPAVLSVTLTLTFRSRSIPESQFSKTWQRKTILRGKGNSGLSYSGIDEIPVSHLTEIAGKSIWLDKAILQIFKPLKMVFCSSCDGVALNLKKENGRASSLPEQIIWAYYWPLLEFAGQYL